MLYFYSVGNCHRDRGPSGTIVVLYFYSVGNCHRDRGPSGQ